MAEQFPGRRFFFTGALLTGAVPAGGFGSTPSLTRLGYKSPNEKLNVAAVGAGGKGASDIAGCAATENVVALCDVDDERGARTLKRYWILLGVIALRFEGKLEWDSARMRITNNAHANELIGPAIRNGWKINWKL
jgi:hypothetical protein